MAFFKSLLKFFLKFFLVIVVILVVLFAGILIYYAATIRSAEEYLPREFLFYVKIDSLREIYDNVIDLKAADVIFSQPEFRSVYDALLQYKSNEFSRNEVLKLLLDMSASLVVHRDNSITLVLEPGLLSVATRNFSLLPHFVDITSLNLTTIKRGSFTLYSISPDGKEKYFFSAIDNLVFFSTKEANIENLYANKESGRNLRQNSGLARVREKLGQKGMLDLYVSTPSLIDMVFKNSAEVAGIFSRISFNDLSLLSFTVSNGELAVGIYSSFFTDNKTIQSLLTHNPGALSSIRSFPAGTSVFSSINIKSFREIWELALVLRGQDLQGTFSQIDGLAKTFLRLSIDDLLFSWTGDEVGTYLSGKSSDPVVFVKVRDKGKLEKVFATLDNTSFFDRDSSLVFNNVRLDRIVFPDIIAGIVNLFVPNLQMPYFYQSDDFIFFCMDPEVLANAINDFKAGKTLVQSETYRKTTDPLPKNANIFLYYDLSRNTPSFFPPDSLAFRLLKLYETGAISVYFHETELKVFLTARGIAGRKTLPFPGFPRALSDGLKSDVLSADLSGSGVGELVYIDGADRLVIQDLVADTKAQTQLEPGSSLVIAGTKWAGNPSVIAYSPSGTINKFGPDAKPLDPFPVVTGLKNSFAPVATGNFLLLFPRQEKNFSVFLMDGSGETKISYEVENPVLSAPDTRDGLIVFYPKTFEGGVHLIDFEGNLKKGWPRLAEGLAVTSPRFVKNDNGALLVAFITQAGRLCVWDAGGNMLPGFPAQLEGTYVTPPLAVSLGKGSPKGIVALSEQGLCTLLTQDGTVVKQKPIADSGDRNSALIAYDMDPDGVDEIFIFGGRNFVIGLDRDLELLPGFPVKGGRKPVFTDLNLDGRKEMLVAGFDNQLYAYEIAK